MLDWLATSSKRRVFWTVLLASFLILDAASWILYSVPGTCIVKTIANGTDNTQNYTCPTFDTFLFDNAAVIGDKVWHLNGLVIYGTVFIALSIWQLIADFTEEWTPLSWFYSLQPTDKFTFALVIVGLLTALIFQGQLNVLQGQLDSMKREEAPFMELTERTGGPIFRAVVGNLGQITWDWHFTNVGKGRAVDIVTEEFMFTGKGGFKRAAPSPRYIAEIPQGKDKFGTALSLPMTLETFNLLQNIDTAISLLLEFRYFDIPGTRYKNAICIGRLASGSIADINPKECANRKIEKY